MNEQSLLIWTVVSFLDFLRSSQTVRRQEKSLDIDAVKENFLGKSASDHDLDG